MGYFGVDEQWTCLGLCGNRVRRRTDRQIEINNDDVMMIDDDTAARYLQSGECTLHGTQIKEQSKVVADF